MATKKARTNYFDIHSLIVKGTGDVRKWKLPVGEILFRPLSQLEIQDAEIKMLGSITDVPTKEYFLKQIDQINEETEENVTINELSPEVNFAALHEAQTVRDLHIVYLSIRDFTDDFNPRDLMKLDGVIELANEILRISGSTPEVQSDLEIFRT
jgi:hypothetical protein